MSEPVAYLLTWTCYGTWLHGDTRGSVDRENNQFGTPFIDPEPERYCNSRSAMKSSGRLLDIPARRIVTKTIEAHCKLRSWILHALNVRTNHVHLVVTADATPKIVMNQLKAWSTRRLREANWVASKDEVWTEGGSKRYLWNERDLLASVQYVIEEQGPEI